MGVHVVRSVVVGKGVGGVRITPKMLLEEPLLPRLTLKESGSYGGCGGNNYGRTSRGCGAGDKDYC